MSPVKAARDERAIENVGLPDATEPTTALDAIASRRKIRSERRHEADILVGLKTEQAALVAKDRQMETEAAPTRYWPNSSAPGSGPQFPRSKGAHWLGMWRG